MKPSLKVHLRRNDRVFVNGAVIKADRKVTLEFLNDVVFLMESHVMQEGDACTPLKQLYYIMQSMLIEPSTKSIALAMYTESLPRLKETFENKEVHLGLDRIDELMRANRVFEAMKSLRPLFALEAEVIKAKADEVAA